MTRLEAAESAERARISALSDGRGDYAHPVFGEGPKDARVMFIGEAPGGEEARLSRPFVGKAGRQLDDMLLRAQIDRSAVYVTNAVKYRPINVKAKRASNRTPSAAEIKAGIALLAAELAELSPRYVVTLGNTPLFAVCAIFGLGGRTIGAAHGTMIELPGGGLLAPQYHPASVIYNRALAEVLQSDLVLLGKAVNGAKRGEKE